MLRILGVLIGAFIIGAIVFAGLSIWRRMAPATLGVSQTAEPTPTPQAGISTPTPTQKNRHVLDRSVSYTLNPLGRTESYGTAILTEIDRGVIVKIGMRESLPDGLYDASLDSGSCASPAAVLYDLNPPVRGSSVTTINTTLYMLQQALFSANVYRRDGMVRTRILCGDIAL